MLFSTRARAGNVLERKNLKKVIKSVLDQYPDAERVLIIPPDFTRSHSGAGLLTEMCWRLLGDRVKAVLPALGTHFPMTDSEKLKMFGELPLELVRDHDWQNGLTELGRISGEEMKEISGGKLDYDWPVLVNRLLLDEPWDLRLSIGQVVPHEVAGMANYTKNIMVGISGKEAIDKSHFLGAVANMEDVMGRAYTPVRKLFNRGAEKFCSDLPIIYLLTVVAPDLLGQTGLHGLFAGDDDECYRAAAELSQELNINLLDKPVKKAVVYLSPDEFRSTWLGNKSIYRTRMALADGGELIVLAPGIRCFGENEGMDGIIRKYGYKGTPYVLEAVNQYSDMADNLSVAAHLIHGSSEDRFKITYCPGGLTREEVESVGYSWGDLGSYSAKYDYRTLKDGWNTTDDGEEIYFISNPALGLWALKSNFKGDNQ
ncbi:MAG: lactate racemase domain-containing protein [Spirochaetales bacterium]|nr:lactate racemase domain-containing protein [Spirochaetales bacterium]